MGTGLVPNSTRTTTLHAAPKFTEDLHHDSMPILQLYANPWMIAAQYRTDDPLFLVVLIAILVLPQLFVLYCFSKNFVPLRKIKENQLETLKKQTITAKCYKALASSATIDNCCTK